MAQEKIDIIISAKNITTDAFNNIKSSLSSITDLVFNVKTGLASLAATVGIGAIAKDTLDTASSFEQIAVSLDTLTGNSEKAMDWIKEFSTTTPYELETVADAYRKLSSYGLDPEKYLEPLGDAASAMGKGLDQSVEMFADAMTGEFERLKEFGIRATTVGDDVTFTWMQNGQQMQVTTQKSAEGISTALGQIFSRFEGSMQKQSETFEGIWANIMDQFTLFKEQIMESGVFDYVKRTIQEVLEKINEFKANGKLDEWAQQISDWTIQGFEKIKEYAVNLVDKYNELKPQLIQFMTDVVKSYNDAKPMIAETIEFVKEMFESIKDGWDILPDWAKDMGLIMSLLGGVKGRVMILSVIHLVDALANSYKGLKAVMSGDLGFTDFATSDYSELSNWLDNNGYANGGVAKGGFKAFASGGIVSQPTLGLVGEGKYNEAIVPLPDGKSIPVQMQGGGNTTINIYAMDAQSFESFLKRNSSAVVDLILDNVRYSGKLKGVIA